MSVPVEVTEGERYPFMFVRFAADRLMSGPFRPNLELTDEQAADLLRVRDEFEAWQDRLAAMLGGHPD